MHITLKAASGIFAAAIGGGEIDTDKDTVLDYRDVCPYTPAGIPVDPQGRPIGDVDLDCDVDLDDVAQVVASFTGPLATAPMDECVELTPNCGPNANCVDREHGYSCVCAEELGWYSDCDDQVGCEIDHQVLLNQCATAIDLGAICGDFFKGGFCTTQTDFVEMARRTGLSSAWFKVTVEGCNFCSALSGFGVHARFILRMPAGADYHMVVYDSCANSIYQEAECGGALEVVTAIASGNHTGEFWIHIRHLGGASCEPWTLIVEGTQ